MLVSEAIDILKTGELNQLKVKEEPSAIIGHLNLGIVEIYKRFQIWKEKATLTMAEGVKRYPISFENTNIEFYDQEHQFILLTHIYDKEGTEIQINMDLDSDYKITLPRLNTIEVNAPAAGDTLDLRYLAAPVLLQEVTDEIQLGPQFWEALFHYVGYRAHGSVKGEINEENNTHYVRFNQSCSKIKREGLHYSDSLEYSKLTERGFI